MKPQDIEQWLKDWPQVPESVTKQIKHHKERIEECESEIAQRKLWILDLEEPHSRATQLQSIRRALEEGRGCYVFNGELIGVGFYTQSPDEFCGTLTWTTSAQIVERDVFRRGVCVTHPSLCFQFIQGDK